MIRALVISHELCLADVGVPCATPAPWPTGPRRPVQGFTLPELLVVIAIISILATAMMAGMASVTQTAKEDRTRTQIAKIHVLLMEKWESFQTRRMPVDSGLPAPAAAEIRLAMLRQTIQLEFPDRITDLLDVDPSVWGLPFCPLPGPPSLYQSYRNKVASIWKHDWGSHARNPQRIGDGAAPPENWTYEHQGAECLFLILSRLTVGDASALEFFNESEIGDVDGDRMNEILDAWGTPIRLLRWPIGFPSLAFANDPQPDPFDPLRVDCRYDTECAKVIYGSKFVTPFYVLPLIVSAGPDGKFEVAFGLGLDNAGNPIVNYWARPWIGRSTESPYLPDPFRFFSDDQDLSKEVGSFANENDDGIDNSLDNIHNHLLFAQ